MGRTRIGELWRHSGAGLSPDAMQTTPKKIIKAAKSKARTASAKIGETDLGAKAKATADQIKGHANLAKETTSATKTRLSETQMVRKSLEGAELAKDSVERAAEIVRESTASLTRPVAEAQTNLATSEIGQRATAKLDAARQHTSDATEAVKEGIDKATGAFAVVHGSVLVTATSGSIETARDKVFRLLKGRENEIISSSLTLQAVMHNFATGIDGLSDGINGKFEKAGLQNRGVDYRSPTEINDLYAVSVPDTVKMLSEFSHDLFLRNKDLSHIESFKNAPGRARDATNVKWEHGSLNRQRGSENMTADAILSADRSNALQGFALGVTEITARSTLYAIAIEATISITENVIYVYRGGKDVPAAIEDTLKNTARAGIAGAVTGVVLGVGITTLTAVGGAPVLVAIAPAVGVVGGGLLVYSAGKTNPQGADYADLSRWRHRRHRYRSLLR